ncbi:hypothetical protein IWQ61_008253 [Dispira simplex]|nr:hypothetical protein IWQ61_008253 [Dispira simplex]
MQFYLPVPKTKPIALLEYFKPWADGGTDAQVTYALTEATAQRERMREALHLVYTHGTNADPAKLVSAIEGYLPHLFYCLRHWQATAEATPNPPTRSKTIMFLWKSPLLLGFPSHRGALGQISNRLQGERFTSDSMYFEVACTLLAYGLALSSFAFRRVGQLTTATQAKTLEPTTVKTYKQPIQLLCQAAGVYQYILEQVLPPWSRVDLHRHPPDLHPGMLQALSKLAMADAQRIAVRISQAQNTSPSLLAKLLLGVVEQYDQAFGLFQTQVQTIRDMTDQTADLRRYLKDGRIYLAACAKRYLATDAYRANRVGVAMGFLQLAKKDIQMLVKKQRSSIVAEAQCLLQEIDQESSLYNKLLSTVSFETVPGEGELLSMIPQGRTLLEVKVFVPSVLDVHKPSKGSASTTNSNHSGDKLYAMQHEYY